MSAPSSNRTASRLATLNAKTVAAAAKADSLQHKEEEYKRLNAELEKRTASLVAEAEKVLRANERNLAQEDYEEDAAHATSLEVAPRPRPPSTKGIRVAAANLSIVDDTDMRQFAKTITNIEVNYEEEGDPAGTSVTPILESGRRESIPTSRFMPAVASEMSAESQIRFLKAKLKVQQEELDRLGGELSRRDEENGKLATRCKELDEERAKQLRISNAHLTSLEKLKKTHEELTTKSNKSEVELATLRKENESLRKETKKLQTEQQQLELRVNRALEEADKARQQATKVATAGKDEADAEKRRVEQLVAENKRALKQKAELIAAFKKQMKLIDILKKQKMHLEAAKMLEFSEAEFLSALEWNSGNVQVPKGGGGFVANSNRSNSSSRAGKPPINQKRSPKANEPVVRKTAAAAPAPAKETYSQSNYEDDEDELVDLDDEGEDLIPFNERPRTVEDGDSPL